MSDNDSDSKTMNEKRQQRSNVTNKDDVLSQQISFFKSIAIVILVFVVYFSCSGLLLFLCKLAQSNILPTESECYPYTTTNVNGVDDPVSINLFTTTADNGVPLSMKIKFPLNDENKDDKLMKVFRQYKERKNSYFLANYFIAIVESVLCFSYSQISTQLNIMNSTFSETFILLFGLPIASLMYVIWIFTTGVYFVYVWFANMSWFFKTNTAATDDSSDSSTQGPKWTHVEMTSSPLQYAIGIAVAIAFTLLLFFGFPFLSIVPFVLLNLSILTCLLYKGQVNEETKPSTCIDIVKGVFMYQKPMIMGLFYFIASVLAFAKLNVLMAFITVIALTLFTVFVIKDAFQPVSEGDMLSKLSDYKQPKKICNVAARQTSKSSGFTGWLREFGLIGGDREKTQMVRALQQMGGKGKLKLRRRH